MNYYLWRESTWRPGKPWKLMNYDTGIADTFYETLDQYAIDLRPYTEPGEWRNDYDHFVKQGNTYHQAWLRSLHIQVKRLNNEQEA